MDEDKLKELLDGFEKRIDSIPDAVKKSIKDYEEEQQKDRSWVAKKLHSSPVLTLSGITLGGVGAIELAKAGWNHFFGATPEESMQAAATLINGGSGLRFGK